MSKRFLIFHLCGPMASWGSISVGSYRPTDDHPTKSAILGIICAALGIDRNNIIEQSRIRDSYDFVCVSACTSSRMVDYHTIASNATSCAVNRYEAIHGVYENGKVDSRPNTTLSTRDYVCNGYYTIIMSERSQIPYTLDELKEAMIKPKYVMYLGRKSCPLSLPVMAEVVEANRLLDLISTIALKPFIEFGMVDPASKRRIFSTYTDDDLKAIQTMVRNDNPKNRSSWTFTLRNEYELDGENND